MIDALIGGKLFRRAEARMSSGGKPFVMATIRAADSDGASMFIRLFAFDDQPKDELAALDDGDSVSVAGPMKITTYDGKPSISMVVQRVVSPYHVTRTRKAVAAAAVPSEGVDDQFQDAL